MKAHSIISMSPTDAISMRDRGVGGDDSAVSDYVKWCAWHRIKNISGFNNAQKIKAFVSFVRGTNIVVDRG